MNTAQPKIDEANRLKALLELDILDTPSEE